MTKSENKPLVALIILDGWGYRSPEDVDPYNAIAVAQPHNMNRWFAQCPHALLRTDGKSVGLIQGMAGNSAVGHLAMGAGRIIEQPLATFHRMINDQSFFNDQFLKNKFEEVVRNNTTLHILGLLSDGAAHSHEAHIHATIEMAVQCGVKKIIVHAILDGRDTPQCSAQKYLEKIDALFKKLGVGKIGTILGRFYAMDRDGNWDRTLKAFDILTKPSKPAASWHAVLEESYAQNLTDEQILPVALDAQAYIHDGDALFVANIRADRMRQIVALLSGYRGKLRDLKQEHVVPPVTAPALLWCITAIAYFKDFSVEVFIKTPEIHNTLLDILSAAGVRIFTIAETEKYAHVTYFFNGYRERSFPHETRVHVSSPKVQKYDEKPEMAAREITSKILEAVAKNQSDFYLINYANADMVGHVGNFPQTVKAIQILDDELGKLYEAIVQQNNGTMIIVADHGAAEQQWDHVLKVPHVAHTVNPVPFIIVSTSCTTENMPLETLADVAPIVLTMYGLLVPSEMQKIGW